MFFHIYIYVINMWPFFGHKLVTKYSMFWYKKFLWLKNGHKTVTKYSIYKYRIFVFPKNGHILVTKYSISWYVKKMWPKNGHILVTNYSIFLYVKKLCDQKTVTFWSHFFTYTDIEFSIYRYIKKNFFLKIFSFFLYLCIEYSIYDIYNNFFLYQLYGKNDVPMNFFLIFFKFFFKKNISIKIKKKNGHIFSEIYGDKWKICDQNENLWPKCDHFRSHFFFYNFMELFLIFF